MREMEVGVTEIEAGCEAANEEGKGMEEEKEIGREGGDREGGREGGRKEGRKEREREMSRRPSPKNRKDIELVVSYRHQGKASLLRWCITDKTSCI